MPSFRLDRYTPLDEPSERKRRLRQVDCDKIEAAFTSIDSQLASITALQTEQAEILADLQTAIRDHAISMSYPAPGEVLSADDNGSDVTITIAAH